MMRARRHEEIRRGCDQLFRALAIARCAIQTLDSHIDKHRDICAAQSALEVLESSIEDVLGQFEGLT